VAYCIRFSDEAREHLEALTARQKATLLDGIERHLFHEPTLASRNRKPMDPDKRLWIAAWEVRLGELRVYYAVEEEPEAVVVIVAIGIKVRERIRIAGEDIEP